MVAKHEKMIQDAASKIFAQHQGFIQININDIKSKIDNVLHPKLQELEMKIKQEFDKYTNERFH
jgi:ERCC4-related helicase